MRGRRVVLGGVVVAAAGMELHDTLDTNVQGFQLLTDDTLRPISWPVAIRISPLGARRYGSC